MSAQEVQNIISVISYIVQWVHLSKVLMAIYLFHQNSTWSLYSHGPFKSPFILSSPSKIAPPPPPTTTTNGHCQHFLLHFTHSRTTLDKWNEFLGKHWQVYSRDTQLKHVNNEWAHKRPGLSFKLESFKPSEKASLPL